MQFDQVFESHDFEPGLLPGCTNLRSIPVPYKNKNVIVSKHKDIREIFKSFKSNSRKFREILSAQQISRIASDLHGVDVCCSICMNRKKVLR